MSALPTRMSPIALALQGGGAYGAFTWGVLDRLLEEPSPSIEAISATSSGAMNALALAQGWLDGGAEGARACLARLWDRIAARSATLALGADGGHGVARWLDVAWSFAPRSANPLGVNVVRDVARELFDFTRLRRSPIRLHVAATRVRDGALTVVPTARLDLDALLASTCLPQYVESVMLDGEAHWDGGFAANPPLAPLLREGRAASVVCVAVQPPAREAVPRTARGIADRMLALGFGATLHRETEALALARRALEGSIAYGRLARRLKALRIVSIAPDAPFERVSHGPFDTRRGALHALHALGRDRAARWLGGDAAAPPSRELATPRG